MTLTKISTFTWETTLKRARKVYIAMIRSIMKRLQQRLNQTISALIIYLNDLEDAWFEKLQKSVRVVNFLTTLHDYLRDEIRDRHLFIDIRKQAHETVLLMKSIMKRFVKTSAKLNERENRFQITTIEISKTKTTSDLQIIVIACFKKRKRENVKSKKKNKSNIECWNCHQKNHYQSNCSIKSKKVKNQ